MSDAKKLDQFKKDLQQANRMSKKMESFDVIPPALTLETANFLDQTIESLVKERDQLRRELNKALTK